MAGAIIKWMREARVITGVAGVELERRVDLVGGIDLVPVATARRSGRVLPDIRINDRLGLLPQIVHSKRERESPVDGGAKARFLSLLAREQRRVGQPQVHAFVLVDSRRSAL
jgi:hypothetical protein